MSLEIILSGKVSFLNLVRDYITVRIYSAGGKPLTDWESLAAQSSMSSSSTFVANQIEYVRITKQSVDFNVLKSGVVGYLEVYSSATKRHYRFALDHQSMIRKHDAIRVDLPTIYIDGENVRLFILYVGDLSDEYKYVLRLAKHVS